MNCLMNDGWSRIVVDEAPPDARGCVWFEDGQWFWEVLATGETGSEVFYALAEAIVEQRVRSAESPQSEGLKLDAGKLSLLELDAQ